MDNKKIGAFIAELRKEKGLNQSELANLLGVTNKAVSKWECGDGYPEITLVPSIAKVLGITVDELLDGERIITSPNLKTTYSDSLMISSMNKFKKYFYISLGLAAFSILDLVVSRAINYNQSEIFAFISFLIFALCLMTSIIIYAIHYNDIKTRIVKYKDSFKKDEYYDMVKSIL
jgi:transcriptional regulator with XRE-family HTH domain